MFLVEFSNNALIKKTAATHCMIKMKWHIMWRWIISNFLFYLTPFLGISRIYVTVYFQFSELNVKMRKGAKKKTIYFADLESHLEPNIEAIIWLQIRNQLLSPQLREQLLQLLINYPGCRLFLHFFPVFLISIFFPNCSYGLL